MYMSETKWKCKDTRTIGVSDTSIDVDMIVTLCEMPESGVGSNMPVPDANVIGTAKVPAEFITRIYSDKTAK